MRAADQDAFRDFATGRTPSLQRSAYLLTGDWQRADDLTRTALAKVYGAWGRLRDENVDGFARRAIVTAQTSWWERLRRSEPTVALPEADHEDERVIVRRALLALPLRQRATVVFHHYDGLDAEVVARILGVSPAFVRTQAARGLAALRAALGDPYSRTATTHYDDERVVEVLRSAVPAVPELAAPAPTVVRQRARLLRTRALTQVIGAVASVLLVVGLAAAVTRGGVGGNGIERRRDPLGALGEALDGEESVRFEARMELVGDPPDGLDESGSMPGHMLKEMFESRVTGAATADGDFEVEGDMPALGGFFFGARGDEGLRMLVVDDDLYRAVGRYDEAPAGKRWIVEEDAMTSDVDELRPLLRRLAAYAKNVEYQRDVEVRGTDAAEYRLTLPDDVMDGEPVQVDFALDAENRLRRVVVVFGLPDYFTGGYDRYDGDYGPDDGPTPPPGLIPRLSRQRARELQVRVTVELFGYGDDVDIEAPPASEVMRPEDMWEDEPEGPDSPLDHCLVDADDDEAVEECFERYGGGVPPLATPMPEGPSPDLTCKTDKDGSTTCSAGSSVGYGSGPRSGTWRPVPVSPSPSP